MRKWSVHVGVQGEEVPPQVQATQMGLEGLCRYVQASLILLWFGVYCAPASALTNGASPSGVCFQGSLQPQVRHGH